ncbi:uncharacterized protein LOC135290727 isoform X4 [Passer domesticus]|uniref:uncharacterized protein LOC135290727 isoform X4 n=2 Tax=Passer domesticus TaxID=48849 RepID=UPI0030FEF62C
MAGPPQPPQPAGHRQAVPGNRWERLPPVPALARLTLSPVPESGGGGCLRGHAANGPDCPVPLSGRGPCQAAAGAERDCSGSHRQGPAALSGIVLLQLPRNALCSVEGTKHTWEKYLLLLLSEIVPGCPMTDQSCNWRSPVAVWRSTCHCKCIFWKCSSGLCSRPLYFIPKTLPLTRKLEKNTDLLKTRQW